MINNRAAQPQTDTLTHPSSLRAGEDEPSLPGFEAALTELEAIVQAMESGQMPLEDALQSFERGNRLLQHCHALLAAAEQRLQVLENGALTPRVIDGEGDA